MFLHDDCMYFVSVLLLHSSDNTAHPPLTKHAKMACDSSLRVGATDGNSGAKAVTDACHSNTVTTRYEVRGA